MSLSDAEILIASQAAFYLGNPITRVHDFPGLDRLNLSDNIKSFRSAKDAGKFDACYVAETETEVILSLRGVAIPFLNGSLHLVLRDWGNSVERQLIAHANFDGKIHKGFWDSIQLLDNAGAMIEAKERLSKNKTLIITGYSKGGALATLAAQLMVTKYNIDPSQILVRFFAAPKCGDEQFVDHFNARFPSTVRYENQYDLIPHFPFSDDFVKTVIPTIPPLMRSLLQAQNNPSRDDYIPGSSDYRHVGQLKFVIDGQLVDPLDPNTRHQALAHQYQSITTTSRFASYEIKRHGPYDLTQAIG